MDNMDIIAYMRTKKEKIREAGRQCIYKGYIIEEILEKGEEGVVVRNDKGEIFLEKEEGDAWDDLRLAGELQVNILIKA